MVHANAKVFLTDYGGKPPIIRAADNGHTQIVEKIRTDGEQDALGLKVRQQGPGCGHAGFRSCFYRNIQEPGNPVALGPEIEDQSYDPDAVYKS